MPKFTGQLFIPSVNKSQYAAQLKPFLDEQLFLAWGAWLDAFISIVPVWSAESVGSLLPLANIIGKDVPTPVAATAPGDRSSQGAAQSSARLISRQGYSAITYTTSIPHLIVNEYIDARIFGFHLKNPGPYNFQQHCKDAFFGVASQINLPAFRMSGKYKKV